MTIQVSADRERFIRSLVEAGRYSSEEAVIEAALQLLQEEGDEEARLAQLRLEIADGIAQADRGELTPIDPFATLARIRDQGADRP